MSSQSSLKIKQVLPSVRTVPCSVLSLVPVLFDRPQEYIDWFQGPFNRLSLFSCEHLKELLIHVLDDRVPEELRTKVHDIVQETRIKTIPKNKKCKKAKWLSEEGLQIAMKIRETKTKGEKERYAHLNVEFKRIARRDKKDFLSDQCKEIEENNRMGKTRDLFKKIRDTKGTFHTKMSTI